MISLSNFADLEVHWESSEDLSDLETASVQSVITSPPYWNLKDYGHDEQIGTTDESYERYLNRLQQVFNECYQCLRDDGTMWIVVDSLIERGNMKLLPYHVAERARDCGFLLQNMIVWYKPTAIAGMNDRTVVNKKEYIVFLSKSESYSLHPEMNEDVGDEDPAKTTTDELGTIWRHPVKRGSLGQNVSHKAPFPVPLAKRLVQVSTEPRNIVLDPFLGSGTTAYAALSEDRRCLGYEINQEFESVVSSRLADLQQSALHTNFQG
ncbi:DNA-methyltransferase [Natrialba asiatica]|uniref:Type II methyltransferase n=1 Tax=Natrialba asiatica (strain ATCC 700177 / DSM 12278 / JCM 9576 / FERM P-10747 / NBRC 102637 / 172P1) TaxID=29540 RepID=M0AHQ5_NATA1|nr:site-specific DNA-methyltransferase [Natrialba asiatica]ELY97906.1 site-specific DNA-methyltransferase [Natrialba asiatica DSM 12278]